MKYHSCQQANEDTRTRCWLQSLMGYAEIPPPGLTKNNCLLTTELKYPEVSFVVSKSIDLLQVSPFWVVLFRLQPPVPGICWLSCWASLQVMLRIQILWSKLYYRSEIRQYHKISWVIHAIYNHYESLCSPTTPGLYCIDSTAWRPAVCSFNHHFTNVFLSPKNTRVAWRPAARNASHSMSHLPTTRNPKSFWRQPTSQLVHMFVNLSQKIGGLGLGFTFN